MAFDQTKADAAEALMVPMWTRLVTLQTAYLQRTTDRWERFKGPLRDGGGGPPPATPSYFQIIAFRAKANDLDAFKVGDRFDTEPDGEGWRVVRHTARECGFNPSNLPADLGGWLSVDTLQDGDGQYGFVARFQIEGDGADPDERWEIRRGYGCPEAVARTDMTWRQVA